MERKNRKELPGNHFVLTGMKQPDRKRKPANPLRIISFMFNLLQLIFLIFPSPMIKFHSDSEFFRFF